MKRFNENWVHVTCALFSEVYLVSDPTAMQVVKIAEVPNDICQICGLPGECIGCEKCGKRAHIRCLLNASEDEPEWDLDDLLKVGTKRKAWCSDCKEELFCFCRKPYQEGEFMICCDNCDIWYHGACVNLTESAGSLIESYI